MRPEKIFLMSQNYQNTKYTEKIKNFKSIKGKRLTYKGRSIKITPYFLIENLKARQAQKDALQTLRDHSY